MAIAIVGQLARLCELLKNNGSLKKFSLSAVKSAQQGKEAIANLASTYPICQVILDVSISDETLFPHRYPSLVRDTSWLYKMTRVCIRYLKHLSFLFQLSKSVDDFNVKPDQQVIFPKLRRAVLPVTWWGMEEDRDILLGVLKHGWGNWKSICSDPQFCFHKQGVAYTGHGMEEDEGLALEAEGEVPESESSVKDTHDKSDSQNTREKSNATNTPEKVFPSPSLLMKRVRRLVDAMETAISKGNSQSLDYQTTPGSPAKKSKKNTGTFMGQWLVKESKALRNAILRWGLPIPPHSSDSATLLSQSPGVTPEMVEKEKEYAVIADVVDGLIRDVVSQLNEHPSHSTVSPELSSRVIASPFAYHRCPLCRVRYSHSNLTYNDSVNQPVETNPLYLTDSMEPSYCTFESEKLRDTYCIFCDLYVGYRLLKVESQLLYKSYEDMQQLSRYIESHAKRIMDSSKEAKEKELREMKESSDIKDTMETEEPGEASECKETKSPESPVPEKAKITENDVILPSTVLAQRLSVRIQLFYDLQQLVWCKDPSVLESFLKRWYILGIHHQDNISRGWHPPLHDAALLAGLYRWGVSDWEMMWRDPDLPFYIEPEEHRRKNKRKKKEEAETQETAETHADAPGEKSPYSLEDAKRCKNERVCRQDLVAGLSSLYVLKRVNAILRFFKQNRSYTIITTVNQIPSDIGVVVSDRICRVRMVVGRESREIPAVIRVIKELFWKRNQNIPLNARYSRNVNTDYTYSFQTPWVQSYKPQPPMYPTTPIVFLANRGSQNRRFPAIPEIPSGRTVAISPGTCPLTGLSMHIPLNRMPSPQTPESLFSKSQEFLRSVQLPLKVHGVTVLCLGQINTKYPTYHNKNYIWPVGYKFELVPIVIFRSVKMYTSFKDTSKRVMYTSEILDGGPNVDVIGAYDH